MVHFMTSRTSRFFVKNSSTALAIAGLLCAGCSLESDQIQQLTEMASKSASTSVAINSEKSGSASAKNVSFQPLFPERTNPFQFPGYQGDSIPESDSYQSQQAVQVRVLGFANVGQPRVILFSNGTTMALKEGEVARNIKVLQITEPTVKLQSGNLVWVATMFSDKAL